VHEESEDEPGVDEGRGLLVLDSNDDMDEDNLDCKILHNWPAVGWIEGEAVKRNVDRRMKIGSDIVDFFVFYKHDDDDDIS
jgi:hypothetical protein